MSYLPEERISVIEKTLFTSALTKKSDQHSDVQNFGKFDLDHFDYQLPEARKLNHFTLLHTERGNGGFNLGLNRYKLKPHSIYFSYPGQVISCIDLKNIYGHIIYGTVEFMLKANPQLLDMKLFQLFGHRHEIRLTEKEHEKIMLISQSMAEELQSVNYRKNEILQSLTNLHVYYTDRCLYQSYFRMEKEMHPKVREFFALMNIKQNANIKVSDYAFELNIAPNYLNDLVRNHTGKSVKTLLKEKTIRQACVFLIHTNDHIKQIAYQLGYNYPQYFDRDFRNAMGMTPVQYRKSNR